MTTTTAPNGSTTSPQSGLDRCFAALHRSSVVRRPGGVFGGVCTGIAQSLGVSTAVVRLAVVGLTLLGIGAPAYLVAWLVLPDHRGTIHLERAIRHGRASSIVLLIVAGCALLPDDHHGGRWIAVAAIAAAFFLWTRGSCGGHRGRQAGPERSADAPQGQSWPPAPTGWPTGPQDAPRN